VPIVEASLSDIAEAMEIIDSAKELLHDEGVDQWQNGYPDEACIRQDILDGKGYFVESAGKRLGYLCIDFDGEPAYEHLQGEWGSEEPYVVVHRMALSADARGRGLSEAVLSRVCELARERGVHSFRVDTDEDNARMKHILGKLGFTYRGTIWFDDSVKIAFDKRI
jgi:GNAT superfamily N-acetyltransferase